MKREPESMGRNLACRLWHVGSGMTGTVGVNQWDVFVESDTRDN